MHTAASDPKSALPEHDGLDPLTPLAIGETHAKRPRVACDQRLAELVAVVAGAVAGLQQDLRRARQLLGVLEGGILP